MKSKQKQKNYTNIDIEIRKYKLHNLLTFYTLTLVMLTEIHVHISHIYKTKQALQDTKHWHYNTKKYKGYYGLI